MISLQQEIDNILQDEYMVFMTTGEGALSYPLPGQIGDRRVERYFITPAHPGAEKYRPFASLAIDPETGVLLTFRRCEVCDFAEALNQPLDTRIDYSARFEGDFDEIFDKRVAFDELYQSIREYAFEETLSEEQTEQIKKYLALQDELFRDALKAFYQSLSPEFYAWADRVVNA